MVEKESKKDEEYKIRIYCSNDFFEIIKNYQDRFYKKHKVMPTIPEVTTIISTKIKNQGGLIV